MDLQLRGKKAIVTGASRGIGRAIAELLASEGADVAICARGADQVASAVADLKAKGVRAFGQAVDIADGPAFKAFITSSAEQLGGLDILVSNASALTSGSGEQQWKNLFDIDVMGAVRAFEAGKPFLMEAAKTTSDAAFIIISSVSAAEAASVSPYGAMKASLIHYAKGVARENAPAGVRANVVSPGTVFFEGGVWGNVKANAPQFFEATLKRNPTGRMATPQEVANAAVFLASPVSAFTTGINLLVDGAISQRVNF